MPFNTIHLARKRLAQLRNHGFITTHAKGLPVVHSESSYWRLTQSGLDRFEESSRDGGNDEGIKLRTNRQGYCLPADERDYRRGLLYPTGAMDVAVKNVGLNCFADDTAVIERLTPEQSRKFASEQARAASGEGGAGEAVSTPLTDVLVAALKLAGTVVNKSKLVVGFVQAL